MPRLAPARPLRFASIAFTIAFLSGAPATAAPLCELLTGDDLASVGIRPEAAPVANSVSLAAEQSGAPSALEAELCFLYHGPRGSTHALNLTVERYASADGLVAWLAKQNASAEVTRSRHGEIDCERGEYDANVGVRPASSEPAQRLLHYVSCDVLKGTTRIAVSVEAADAKPLPTEAAVARLIDAVVPKLK